MDFSYTIYFQTQTGVEVIRKGRGQFYPHDDGFNLEHMLWEMTEEYGRPLNIEVKMEFGDGTALRVKQLAPPSAG